MRSQLRVRDTRAHTNSRPDTWHNSRMEKREKVRRPRRTALRRARPAGPWLGGERARRSVRGVLGGRRSALEAPRDSTTATRGPPCAVCSPAPLRGPGPDLAPRSTIAHTLASVRGGRGRRGRRVLHKAPQQAARRLRPARAASGLWRGPARPIRPQGRDIYPEGHSGRGSGGLGDGARLRRCYSRDRSQPELSPLVAGDTHVLIPVWRTESRPQYAHILIPVRRTE